MSSKLRNALLPLLASARDHYYELLDHEAAIDPRPQLVDYVTTRLKEDVLSISRQLDGAIIDMRAKLIADMDILFSNKCYLRYEHSAGMEFTPEHCLTIGFVGAVSTIDCGPPAQKELILACQTMAEILNTLLREAKISLIVFVTVMDPDAE